MATKKHKEKVYVYGKHALIEALTNTPQLIRRVFLAPDVRDAELSALLKKYKLQPSKLSKGSVSSMTGARSHQGVIGVLAPGQLLQPFDAFLSDLDFSTKPALILLTGLEDPHNTGAIIRSAAAFGISGVLLPEKGQASVGSTVLKASAGMAFQIPLVSVRDTKQVLEMLKARGFTTYALTGSGSAPLSQTTFDTPSVFIVGNESHGIPKELLANTDVRLRIPIHKRAESLNAAVSAGIVCAAWSAKHPEHLS